MVSLIYLIHVQAKEKRETEKHTQTPSCSISGLLAHKPKKNSLEIIEVLLKQLLMWREFPQHFGKPLSFFTADRLTHHLVKTSGVINNVPGCYDTVQFSR